MSRTPSVSFPRGRLALWLLAAGVGLGLFFAGGYRELPLPLGWVGTFLFVAAVWFAFGVVLDGRSDEAELEVAAAEWQAWIGAAFLGVIVVLLLMTLGFFNEPLPIQRNPDLGALGYQVGGWFVAWALLAHALQKRWQRHVQEDEFDRRIQHTGESWGSAASSLLVTAIAVTLGFNEPAWLAGFSYAFWAQLLMLCLLAGWLVQQLTVALLHGRERRAAQRAA